MSHIHLVVDIMKEAKLLDVHIAACSAGPRVLSIPLEKILAHKGSLIERILSDVGFDSLPTNDDGHRCIKVSRDM